MHFSTRFFKIFLKNFLEFSWKKFIQIQTKINKKYLQKHKNIKT